MLTDQDVSGNIQLPTVEEEDEGTLDEPVLTTLVRNEWNEMRDGGLTALCTRPALRNGTGRLS